MKILIVSDAWYPQTNGVVRTLDMVRGELRRQGHAIVMITPDQFRSLPCPGYGEIRLALTGAARVGRMIDDARPDAVHIATEGPLGQAARRCCLRAGLPFTTAYHTNFPDYIHLRTGLPERWLAAAVRRFHAPAETTMATTPTMMAKLREMGLSRLSLWSRGVDTTLFRPRNNCRAMSDLPRPIYLNVGRVAQEKNLEAFLSLDLPGSKVIVGDGPALESMKARYPDAHFTGARHGEALAAVYAMADIFVFPSRTDTFGLVMLEALASGLPVAAFPVPGPLDVIGPEGRGVKPGFDAPVGALREDLQAAIAAARLCRPEDCRAYAELFSWRAAATQFLDNLQPLEIAA